LDSELSAINTAEKSANIRFDAVYAREHCVEVNCVVDVS
jgi:hypothetical protein